jgi:hypothetical protein
MHFDYNNSDIKRIHQSQQVIIINNKEDTQLDATVTVY